MPDDHRPAVPQVTAVDDQFGTHRFPGATGPARPDLSRSLPVCLLAGLAVDFPLEAIWMNTGLMQANAAGLPRRISVTI
ncbi:MAG: hypothetical protein JO364_13125 [Pseudonocardiales bacterium]|nr:hypothetical protein [Pseudonocardiales bacterium]MBV9031214.1 hypothetical protein [Pseudonocardiales bacterium]